MKKVNNVENRVLQDIKKASNKGVLLYKTNKPEEPTTWDQIVRVPGVREDAFYNLEFIVKDEEGNLREMWFGDEKGKRKKGRGR